MILHFITDDKFSGYAIKQFSGTEMCSDFIIISEEKSLKYIDEGFHIPAINPLSSEFKSAIRDLNKYKAIILHGLFWPWQEDVLRAVPSGVKVGWVFWGGDIYGRTDIKGEFLSHKTRLVKNLRSGINALHGKKEAEVYELPKKLLSRIDYCLTDIPEDLEFASKYLGKEITGLWYNYYSIEETIGALADSKCSGNNILIGNSATLECNHIDAIDILTRLKPSGQVIAPLSYGKPWVKNIITKYGKAKLKDRFQPLTQFLPLDEYNKVILSCPCVVMPHYRPQAFGNIITSLWLGCRVYLSDKNPLLSFFERNGFHIFSIEQDLRQSAEPIPLSPEQTEHNRAILRELYSVDTMHHKIIELVNTLES